MNEGRLQPCVEPDCDTPGLVSEGFGGYCKMHYELHINEIVPVEGYEPKKPVCKTEGCGKPPLSRGLCRKHYDQWYADNKRTKAAAGEKKRKEKPDPLDDPAPGAALDGGTHFYQKCGYCKGTGVAGLKGNPTRACPACNGVGNHKISPPAEDAVNPKHHNDWYSKEVAEDTINPELQGLIELFNALKRMGVRPEFKVQVTIDTKVWVTPNPQD